MEDVCLNVSYASVSKDKLSEECLKIGSAPLITKSNALYFQIKVSPFPYYQSRSYLFVINLLC